MARSTAPPLMRDNPVIMAMKRFLIFSFLIAAPSTPSAPRIVTFGQGV
ncbi:MAG: hypothetical protein JNL43_07425 [Flavobacteriales bacterium]|nr:hypothetical protein [Flavobacteriales bacterium]HRH69913.1 hypothetical protein [Flavobacteriales bacterium]